MLAEALPYIRRFWGHVVVVKYGGSAMADPALAQLFAQDVALMRSVGMRPVVVHGALAVGLSGEDAGLITASARSPELGFVGDVEAVNASILERLLAEELIPVVATIGTDPQGQAYNINADTAAGAIAEALTAEKLVYLTNVEGLLKDVEDPGSVISSLTASELEAMLGSGSLSEGMIPKAASCVRAVSRGVGGANILDGRVPHALLLEIFTTEGIGTMVEP